MIHRLFHGHWPIWEPVRYNLMDWEYDCSVCSENRT